MADKPNNEEQHDTHNAMQETGAWIALAVLAAAFAFLIWALAASGGDLAALVYGPNGGQ